MLMFKTDYLLVCKVEHVFLVPSFNAKACHERQCNIVKKNAYTPRGCENMMDKSKSKLSSRNGHIVLE